jgi:hypothetical protein
MMEKSGSHEGKEVILTERMKWKSDWGQKVNLTDGRILTWLRTGIGMTEGRNWFWVKEGNESDWGKELTKGRKWI